MIKEKDRSCDNCKHNPEGAYCFVADRIAMYGRNSCDKWEDMWDDRTDAEKRDDARLEGFLH